MFLHGKKAAHLKKEKEKARQIRRSRWWQNKISHCSCYYCGMDLTPEAVTMDHILPLSRGGSSNKGNLATACKNCNNRKKNLTPVEWVAYLDGSLNKQNSPE